MATQVGVGNDPHGVLKKVGVRNNGELTVQPSQVRLAECDLFYPTLDVLAFDMIADAHLLAHHDQDTCKEVFEDVLEGEANRNRTEADHSQEASGVYPREQHGKSDKDAEQPNQYSGEGDESATRLKPEVCYSTKADIRPMPF